MKGYTMTMAFLSYTHIDNRKLINKIDIMHQRIELGVKSRTGIDNFVIFKDSCSSNGIRTGQIIDEVIKLKIEQALFLIPCLSPSFLRSEYCMREFFLFLDQERKIKERFGMSDEDGLIFPIFIIEEDKLVNRDNKNEKYARIYDEVHKRLYVDFRNIFESDTGIYERGFSREHLTSAFTQKIDQVANDINKIYRNYFDNEQFHDFFCAKLNPLKAGVFSDHNQVSNERPESNSNELIQPNTISNRFNLKMIIIVMFLSGVVALLIYQLYPASKILPLFFKETGIIMNNQIYNRTVKNIQIPEKSNLNGPLIAEIEFSEPLPNDSGSLYQDKVKMILHPIKDVPNGEMTIKLNLLIYPKGLEFHVDQLAEELKEVEIDLDNF